jgi:hypothetical protein
MRFVSCVVCFKSIKINSNFGQNFSTYFFNSTYTRVYTVFKFFHVHSISGKKKLGNLVIFKGSELADSRISNLEFQSFLPVKIDMPLFF